MKKIIKRIGNSIGIIFDKNDAKIYGFEVGQVIEFEPEIIKKIEIEKKMKFVAARKKQEVENELNKN